MPRYIDRHEGQRLFGLNPQGYGDARPPYPGAIYRFLVEQRAIGPGTATLEIGAGNGLATRGLIECGANPITVVEPDVRFAPTLRGLAAADVDVRIVHEAFEDAELGPRAFDLVAAATSFHWLDPDTALDKIADVLKPGGYVALWWNVFGDPERDDAFHDATKSILADLAISPSGAPDAIPFPLDRRARETQFLRSGRFEAVKYAETSWSLMLDTAQVGKLYESFSHIQRLGDAARARILTQLMEVAQTQFGGRVERNMTSPIYVARQKDS